jgi:hypothetical protein
MHRSGLPVVRLTTTAWRNQSPFLSDSTTVFIHMMDHACGRWSDAPGRSSLSWGRARGTIANAKTSTSNAHNKPPRPCVQPKGQGDSPRGVKSGRQQRPRLQKNNHAHATRHLPAKRAVAPPREPAIGCCSLVGRKLGSASRPLGTEGEPLTSLGRLTLCHKGIVSLGCSAYPAQTVSDPVRGSAIRQPQGNFWALPGRSRSNGSSVCYHRSPQPDAAGQGAG